MKTVAIAVLAAVAAAASASTVTESFNAQLSIPFAIGDGNSNTSFAITRVAETAGSFEGNQIEIALKAKQRFVDDLAAGAIQGSTYTVQPGLSDPAGSTPGAWWNYEGSIDLGSRTLANTLVTFAIDMPVGTDIALTLNSVLPSSLSVIQFSENLLFLANDGIPGFAFDPNAAGTYGFTLTVADLGSGEVLGSRSITVSVVPTPHAAGAGLLGLGVLATRRGRA